jgi:nicotinamide-nucleotide amidase
MDENLEKRLGEVLRSKNLRISLAESCTGGLISHRITNVSGSSDYFERGVIAYSNNSKTELLGVSKVILESFGAVSSETAKAMAEGVRKLSNSDLGLAVTGIAGPLGGTSIKPVGLVYMALSSSKSTIVREFKFQGSRNEVKEQSSEEALKMVLTHLEEE